MEGVFWQSTKFRISFFLKAQTKIIIFIFMVKKNINAIVYVCCDQTPAFTSFCFLVTFFFTRTLQKMCEKIRSSVGRSVCPSTFSLTDFITYNRYQNVDGGCPTKNKIKNRDFTWPHDEPKLHMAQWGAKQFWFWLPQVPMGEQKGG